MHSKKISKKLLKMNSINGPSCNDLNGCDCEGWLFLKKESYEERWCVLRNNQLKLLQNPEDSEEIEPSIKILNRKIFPIIKSKSKNFYFKIYNDENGFLFGTTSKSDYYKWLNKLQLSAADIKIDETDGPVGGFTSGYVIESTNFLQMVGDLSSINEGTVENVKQPNIQRLSNSSFETPTDTIDNRIKLYYNKSLSKSEIIPNPPPRKKHFLKNNKHFLNIPKVNVSNVNKKSPSLSVTSINEDSYVLDEEKDENDFRVIEGNHTLSNSKCSLKESYPFQQLSSNSFKESNKSQKKSNNSQLYHNNENENKKSENVIEIDENNIYLNEQSNINGTELKIISIKKVAEIERLIRDKSKMLMKIDQVLRSSHLPNHIQEFWDENGQDILKINANN